MAKNINNTFVFLNVFTEIHIQHYEQISNRVYEKVKEQIELPVHWRTGVLIRDNIIIRVCR